MALAEQITKAGRKLPTWVVYVALLLPAPWFVFDAAGHPEPIKALEHGLGLFSLQLLIATLCITPLRKYAGVNVLRFRRALGLMAFFYLVAHLGVWLVLDVQTPARIWADIVKRPYITIGMAGFLLLVPLAVTSNRASIRKLGRNWQRVHWLIYPAVALAALHFIWLRKGIQVEPVLYALGIAGLLAMRIRWKAKRVAANRG